MSRKPGPRKACESCHKPGEEGQKQDNKSSHNVNIASNLPWQLARLEDGLEHFSTLLVSLPELAAHFCTYPIDLEIFQAPTHRRYHSDLGPMAPLLPRGFQKSEAVLSR